MIAVTVHNFTGFVFFILEEIVPANNKPRIVLKELAKKKYAVTVRAVSIDQFQGPKSEKKTATPTDNSMVINKY